TFALTLDFIWNTTGGTLFLFATLAPVLALAGALILFASWLNDDRQRQRQLAPKELTAPVYQIVRSTTSSPAHKSDVKTHDRAIPVLRLRATTEDFAIRSHSNAEN